jgi:hypothetical protein
MTVTKDGKYYCSRHKGTGQVRRYITVPDDTSCSMCSNDEIIMDNGIIGYRGWNVEFENDNYYLTSLVVKKVWTFRERQECINREGFYSVKAERTDSTLSIPKRILSTQVIDYYPLVIGEVWLWGEIVETELLYCAQYCYPKSLYLREECINRNKFDPLEIASQLEGNYGIPVFLFKEWEESCDQEKR